MRYPPLTLTPLYLSLHWQKRQALFQYVDEEGQSQPVDSGQVNDYLRDAMGEAFTAKDIRTWGGTLAAFQCLAEMPRPDDASERMLAQLESDVVRQVAGWLGNTPAVCRRAYIDPEVFRGWREGRLQRGSANARGPRQWERAALGFLRRMHRS